ncbi:MAG: antitoxin [Stygiobacter sp. RIFOXYC12_FULL_38_8]|nr:MAG: antitoxin [Stygiobacter sp. GWC2_38_9]OGU79244.1 MAG: antitoxin [Stygiobacter sp. RIFOXYA12_FULL_38_9]OGV06909.1 MAG: antitoxin [Stygiobacter sp. RIFOXYB2_FULL_37_11]OGV11560.1 MAG: antitoxin [Stygiobacter sp. RIFOXYA2_FULL_38_8]OGV13368.1 MAG: antitoxin [Stygiobacter sp. RIFOXYC2_FULL_38_25]OGV30316.1 MAG: antitoxin [Stygiobacter sp. RIFOXYC12_FULL_38_8]OGV83414.1 MAG: antitoxin [Stygiobacter sp. GWF2_38_21]RJQ62064.1 MAG: DUF86 domain-containing protein [Stygiobacter sp.]
MDIRIKTGLLDIRQCIDEIYLFLGENRDFLAYKADLKTKKAVERNIEIIGEAVNRILKTDSNFQLNNAKNIIGTRNRIIHSYDNISDEVIWTIVCRELPDLKIQVEVLLKEE